MSRKTRWRTPTDSLALLSNFFVLSSDIDSVLESHRNTTQRAPSHALFELPASSAASELVMQKEDAVNYYNDEKCFDSTADDDLDFFQVRLDRAVIRDKVTKVEDQYFFYNAAKFDGNQIRRPSKANKHEKVNTSRYASVHEQKKIGDPNDVTPSIYTPAPRTYSPAPVSSSSRRKPRSDASNDSSQQTRPQTREELELQKVINASRSDHHASGLTFAQLAEITSRELTPEDYEMLLLLDAQVKPKTAEKTSVESLRESVLAESDCSGGNASDCAVCMCPFEIGNTVKHLPCKHYFHKSCIVPWLQGHSQNCPLCNAKVL